MPPRRPPTKHSTPRLSEVTRELVIPSGIVTTGWKPVEAKLAELGITFDVWQQGAAQLILGKRANGTYAATIGGVVLSIPRQVGKTFLVGWIVFALCMLYPQMTVIWTAHRTRTATITFQSMRAMARRAKVRPHVLSIRQGKSDQEIGFRNGSVIMFGAREQGFGRGFDAVDIEVFDEAQILTVRALEDMIPAANQAQHPAGALLFFMGTPPRPADPGEAFTEKRTRALSGKSSDMVYIECSGDPDADPDDPEQVAKANPSYPHRTPPESIQRMRENLPDDESFLREGLGIWDALTTSGVIPIDAWLANGDTESLPVDRFALGIEAAPDLAAASVALAGVRSDGDWHVELDEHRAGAAWLSAYVERLLAVNPQVRAVVGDVGGPLAAMLEQRSGRWMLKGTRIVVTAPTVKELGAAHSLMLNGALGGTVHHLAQPQLSAAVQVAGKRALGDTGMWVFSRKSAAADITPIQAATLALLGAQRSRVRRPIRGTSGTTSSERRRAVVM